VAGFDASRVPIGGAWDPHWPGQRGRPGRLAHHVDHMVTDTAQRAARRVIEAAYSDDQARVPFHELVQEEQRKMLRDVRSDDH
jgi:hypothetical protein